MNSHQRGIYQPLLDKVPIYDLEEDEDAEEERSRLPLLIVAGLVMLAAFSGVVWLAYNQGMERGNAGSTRIIPAPAGPIRTEPSEAMNQSSLPGGLSIYERPVSPVEEAANSQLAAAAPTPEALPLPAVPQVRPASDVGSLPPPRASALPKAATIAPPPETEPAPAPVAAAPPAATRGFFLQIGAYESTAVADGAWKSFRTRFAEIAGSLSQDVQRADLGARGIWYRLRAGPFADRASAISACEKLKARGGNCFVTAS